MRKYQNDLGALTAVQDLPVLAGAKLQWMSTFCRDKRCRTGCKALGSAVIAALLLSACAIQTMDPPVAQLTRAEAAIQNAVQAGARQTAPVELQTAQQHFSQAQVASAEEEYQQAFYLAEKAEVDAQLAESKARTAEAYNALTQLKEGIRVLEEELRRETR